MGDERWIAADEEVRELRSESNIAWPGVENWKSSVREGRGFFGGT
jgi:hypothetical protein